MIYYISLSAGVFCGLVIYQHRQPAGITPLDIIFCAVVAAVWPIVMICVWVIGVAKAWQWLESRKFMNKRIL